MHVASMGATRSRFAEDGRELVFSADYIVHTAQTMYCVVVEPCTPFVSGSPN